MDRRGVKDRQRAELGRHQQAYLRTAENNPFRSLLRQGGDRLQIIVPRCLAEGAETELVEDDLIDPRPIVGLGDQRLDGKLLLQTTAVKGCLLYTSPASRIRRYLSKDCSPLAVFIVDIQHQLTPFAERCV